MRALSDKAQLGLSKDPAIYQINVALRDIRPLIWRRLQVPADLNLPKLHLILQVSMGWGNYHLHEFRSAGRAYAEPDPEDDHFGRDIADERRVKLSKLLASVGSSCEYIYDFGDNWRHDILLEAILPVKPRKFYPACLGGARSAPPEDVGGTMGYQHYLEALFDMRHEDHRAMLNWRGRFDPEHFPITSVNRDLREAFPPSTVLRKKASPSRPKVNLESSPFAEEFNHAVRSIIRTGTLPKKERIRLRRNETIPLPFSARDCELLAEHSFADPRLTDRLQLEAEPGKPKAFSFTFNELEELAEAVAAEANHAEKKMQREWDILYDRIALVLDDYLPTEAEE